MLIKSTLLVVWIAAGIACSTSVDYQTNPQVAGDAGSTAFLALGDSYTIGSSVDATDRWPAQLSRMIAETSGEAWAVTYRARSGWTTSDLLYAIEQDPPEGTYEIVSLLIGVNNQFRGQDFSNYEQDVPELLDAAIRFVDGDPERVFVVSIPDYAYTPYAQELSSSDRARISSEIDAYNSWMRNYVAARGISYVDITPITRRGLEEPSLVASDGLHPSGAAYREFAAKIHAQLF